MATAPKAKAGKKAGNPADEAFAAGMQLVSNHRLLGPLMHGAYGASGISVHRGPQQNYCPAGGWAACVENNAIHVHPKRLATAQEWAWVLGHCILHFAFLHFKTRAQPTQWNAVACCTVNRFLEGIKFGRPPSELVNHEGLPSGGEEALYEQLCQSGIPPALEGLSVAGPRVHDLWFIHQSSGHKEREAEWRTRFAEVLSQAVAATIQDVAKGASEQRRDTPGERARSWFLNHYPLLGGLVASFEIEENPEPLRRLDIAVGAVAAWDRKIYINSQRLSEEELKFVMAHEVLHAALRHEDRCRGRDEYLWNVACDFAINLWLVEMAVGTMPPGLLLDPELQGLSAETIYDRIITDARRYRKHPTFRNAKLGDLIRRGPLDLSGCDYINLDDFYRNALGHGLEYHLELGRGFLPAGLIEEIRALSQPPIPWEVELATWLDRFIDPVHKTRTFTRLSRRQSATPSIPRPVWIANIPHETRTFGVIIDTSASMFWRKARAAHSGESEHETLGKAIGAIVSYAVAREVRQVRVVFCDALPYDQGYLAVEDLAQRVQLKGKGGTVLQPAVNLLGSAKDFPADAPVLIITDGMCDVIKVPREHAFLLPPGRHLPFAPAGPVFRID